MVTTQTAELFITFITFFISYIVIVTGANIFRAWVAYKMGDDTGIKLGFLSLNPFIHIDPIGLCFLFILNFGWGAVVPIYPFNIKAPWRNLKLAVAYLSDTFAHLVFSVFGMIALLLIFNARILSAVYFMVMSYDVSHLAIARIYPTHSTVSVCLGFIIFTFVYLNVVMGVLTFIINISNYLIFVFSNHFAKISQYGHYITMGLPIILILFFSGLFRFLVVSLISYIGLIIVHTMGMLA